MRKLTYIEFEIDKKTLELVIKAFNDIFENWYNPKIVDNAQVFLTIEELQNSIKSLQNYYVKGANPLMVRMGFNEWVGYTGFLSIVDNSLPNMNKSEVEDLEALLDKYFDWDEDGLAPTGP